jgi:hypothetical protein
MARSVNPSLVFKIEYSVSGAWFPHVVTRDFMSAQTALATMQRQRPDVLWRLNTIEQTEQGPQQVIPGAERSAHQATAARNAQGHGRIRARKPQQEPGGVFAPRRPSEPTFDWEG